MASLIWMYIIVILLTAPGNLEARRKRILGLFPHPGVSHFHFFHPILRGLAERGHEVTVISHFPDKSPPVGYHDVPLTGLDTLTNSVDLKVSFFLITQMFFVIPTLKILNFCYSFFLYLLNNSKYSKATNIFSRQQPL